MFNRARSTLYRSSWASGNDMALRAEGPEIESGRIYFSFSLLFIFFSFSFPLVFFQLLQFCFAFFFIELKFFKLKNFFPIALETVFAFQLIAISQKSFARSCDSRISSLALDSLHVKIAVWLRPQIGQRFQSCNFPERRLRFIDRPDGETCRYRYANQGSTVPKHRSWKTILLTLNIGTFKSLDKSFLLEPW